MCFQVFHSTPWIQDFTSVFKESTQSLSQLTFLDGGSLSLILDLQNSYITRPSKDASIHVAFSNSVDFGAVYASQVKVNNILAILVSF